MKRPPGQAGSSDGGGRIRLPALHRLAAGTAALTFVLILLGVWTAVAGYGLTCDGRWPFCDGAVFGLFPANFGSFVEWFHRLVAMVTGFAILGTAVTAWRRGADRRVRGAFGLALALTPMQVVLGALTVTEYEAAILAAHFGTALVILTLLVGGAVWLSRVPLPAVDLSGLAGAAGVGALALAPGLVVTGQSTGMHVAYVALALAGYVALLGVAVSPTVRHGELRVLSGVGAALLAVGLVVGRVRVDPAARTVVVACLVGGVLIAIATAWLAHSDVLGTDRIGPAEF